MNEVDTSARGIQEARSGVEQGIESVSRLLRLGWRYFSSKEAGIELDSLRTKIEKLMCHRKLVEINLPKASGKIMLDILGGKQKKTNCRLQTNLLIA